MSTRSPAVRKPRARIKRVSSKLVFLQRAFGGFIEGHNDRCGRIEERLNVLGRKVDSALAGQLEAQVSALARVVERCAGTDGQCPDAQGTGRAGVQAASTA